MFYLWNKYDTEFDIFCLKIITNVNFRGKKITFLIYLFNIIVRLFDNFSSYVV